MKKHLLLIFLFCVVCVSFSTLPSAFAQQYSVYNLPMNPYSEWSAYLDSYLDAAAERGFNTIAFVVHPDTYEYSGWQTEDGYISNPNYRSMYREAYEKILTHTRIINQVNVPSQFNLMIRIWSGSTYISNADRNRRITWEDNDYWLRHTPQSQGSTKNPKGVSEPWIDDIDFNREAPNGERTRYLNFDNDLEFIRK